LLGGIPSKPQESDEEVCDASTVFAKVIHPRNVEGLSSPRGKATGGFIFNVLELFVLELFES
jgi:hypothetical protein